jgi:hypothetical protein
MEIYRTNIWRFGNGDASRIWGTGVSAGSGQPTEMSILERFIMQISDRTPAMLQSNNGPLPVIKDDR